MVKKKNKHSDKTFFDVVGLKNILQNDIVNFIFGIVLLLLSIYMIIAFMSFFSTGQYDQSLILDHSPQDVLNKDREFRNSCGSVGAFVSYFFISRCFPWMGVRSPESGRKADDEGKAERERPAILRLLININKKPSLLSNR